MRAMSKILLILLAGFALTACQPSQGVLLASGEYAERNNWNGQWRVINIWAEWCKPCWQEIPELNQFYMQQGAIEKLQKVQLLGFNFDELSQEELVLLKEKMSINFPVITQWPKEWPVADIKGLPATLIMNPEGEIETVLWGPQNLESLNAAINTFRYNDQN